VPDGVDAVVQPEEPTSPHSPMDPMLVQANLSKLF
jgi:hypothetical protein